LAGYGGKKYPTKKEKNTTSLAKAHVQNKAEEAFHFYSLLHFASRYSLTETGVSPYHLGL
jgi:hypothetical protein